MHKYILKVAALLSAAMILAAFCACSGDDYKIYRTGFEKFASCKKYSVKFSLVGKYNSETPAESAPSNFKCTGNMDYNATGEKPKFNYKMSENVDGDITNINTDYDKEFLTVKYNPGFPYTLSGVDLNTAKGYISWANLADFGKSDAKKISYDKSKRHLTALVSVDKISNQLIDSYMKQLLAYQSSISKDDLQCEFSDCNIEYFFNGNGTVNKQVVIFNVNVQYQSLNIPYSIMCEMSLSY